jgi:hypothetical protein
MRLIRRIRRRSFPPRELVEGYENEELVDTIFRKTVAYEPEGAHYAAAANHNPHGLSACKLSKRPGGPGC